MSEPDDDYPVEGRDYTLGPGNVEYYDAEQARRWYRTGWLSIPCFGNRHSECEVISHTYRRRCKCGCHRGHLTQLPRQED